ARCASILGKSKNAKQADVKKNLLDTLVNDEAFAVCKILVDYDETIKKAALKNEPSFIARYLIDLASAFNQFYVNHKVASDSARLSLTECVKNTLKNGMELLLMKAPEKM
ncbi:MAG: DALR anticodon-binding domain-containing protein, partial [Firmicutes bacterium]|nr:DALR anticodon-binding domain-containing protein [Bacillota bacterium]